MPVLTEPEYLRLSEAWTAALAPWLGVGAPFTLLFSGGLDSTLLAWELRASPRLNTLTVGLTGAHDLRAAEEAAAVLGVPWHPVPLDDAFLDALAARIRDELAPVAPRLRSVFLALAAACHASPTVDVLCGQGADELFLGYAHYRGLDEAGQFARSEADVHQLLQKDWPRSVRIAERLGHRLHAPYLDERWQRIVRAIPIGQRSPIPRPKELLRAFARRRGLPEEFVSAPKRALQYGSGVDRWLARRSRPARPPVS